MLRAGRVPLDYPKPVAADYSDCLAIVQKKVRPEREQNNRKVYRDRWWHYAEKRPELYATTAGCEQVLATAQTSNKWCPTIVRTGIVYSHTVVVFPDSSFGHYAAMQAVFHEQWRLEYGASLKRDARYTPSDCYDTFPFPSPTDAMQSIGALYYENRQRIMHDRKEGLTQTYKRFHDKRERSTDIVRLRVMHQQMNEVVANAFGWTDLNMELGFHETKQGSRFTVSPTVREEMLNLLLELNHLRYAAEVARGLHEKKGRGAASRRLVPASTGDEPALF
jgi:hypothetical protein